MRAAFIPTKPGAIAHLAAENRRRDRRPGLPTVVVARRFRSLATAMRHRAPRQEAAA